MAKKFGELRAKLPTGSCRLYAASNSGKSL